MASICLQNVQPNRRLNSTPHQSKPEMTMTGKMLCILAVLCYIPLTIQSDMTRLIKRDANNDDEGCEPAEDSFEELMLNEHNAFRAKHDAAPLVWDERMASTAADWISACNYVHSPPALAGVYGENIVWGSGYTPLELIRDWEAEGPQHGAYNHYTQMVWKSTKTLGCAQKACPGDTTFIACHYGPDGGNVEGELAQNVS
ncbi:uncharacterized protein L969DRAFT_17347 [Mixia osmundae IAM 14324]|uniref:SCP domain-containing protein n=1 Tax=Mixia osmundae (strain CBS 9802 / IAM 14324 / JCM 22182 / KY 12970) TaxID=764103 RepID=G7E3N5_MIXOS|nr:uncharacterized protein L969DRAFT_17347 [Mixia osmundae IAM 14324]KEI39428.1 hypothetical protein L969DRAFT_17347 [Mixia osmundae IAM 14324]GAA97445.1 hypothetical protein E5Q_04124 [Mixia osmundae IAM 14324]